MNKTIQSGRLLQSVEIHGQSSSLNALRERVNTWSKITDGDWRCQIETVRGGESEGLGGQLGQTVYQVKGYYRSDIGKNNRLVWGSMVLDIIHIENVDQRHEVLIIDAVAISREGVQAK